VNRRNANTILIILGVLGIVLLIFFRGDEKKYTWTENYKAASDQPYGTMFMRNLLEESSTGDFVVRDKNSLKEFLKKENLRQGTNYVFIGESLFLGNEDKDALLKFVEDGNDAFISTKEVPDFIPDLYSAECGNLVILDDNSTITPTLNFYHESLHDKYGYKYSFRLQDEDVSYNWTFFNEALFCDSTRMLTPLGYQDEDQVNFFRVRYGKGNLYLHSSPVVFTNYFMIQKQKMEYASAVFSHLQNQNVIWEEFGKIPRTGGDDGLNSPLYYVMQQPSLKYAWWLIVASTLLYVLFAAKRTQRVIPVLQAKTNTSLEFVKMISSLHYQNKDHMDMARKKMKYFYYFIRSRYGIHGHPFTPEMAAKLSEKSSVPKENVDAVFKFYKLIEEGSNGRIDEIRLSNFYNVVEIFYKKCK
jgi:hypothetical protein